VASADRRDPRVGDADRPTGAFASNCDVGVVRGGRLVERGDTVLEVLDDHCLE
jgi:hypothetical protein